MTWYALQGSVSSELLTFKMCVMIHDNPRELEWLITNARVVQMLGESPFDVASWLGRRVMLLRDHPDLSHVRWPLDKNDFWDPHLRSLDRNAVRRAAWQ